MPSVKESKEPRFELKSLWTAKVDDYATALSYSHDGTRCAVASASGVVHVLDARGGESSWQALAHAQGVLAAAFNPACPILATGGQDGKARLFDEAGRPFAELPGAAPWVELLAWSPDGSKVATASGKIVRVWRADGSPYLETEPHPSTVTGVAWNRAGTELATSCSGGVHLWNVAARARAKHLPWKGSLISLAWSPDGKVIACAGQDCSVHFWRLPLGKDAEMTGYPFKPRSIAWDARATLLATTGDAVITLWDFGARGPEGTTPLQLEAHKTQVLKVAFSPRKGTLASGAQDGSVMLWEPRKGKAPVGYAFLDDVVSALQWGPAHESLLGADGAGNVTCWRVPA